MIRFFINIINIILLISLIICQKCVLFTFISAKFLVLLLKFFCLPLLIILIFVKMATFFIINKTFSFLWPITIVIIIIAIVNILVLVLLITTIILPKSTICKVLNISSIAVIVCYDKRLKLGKKIFKGCCRSK